MLSATARTPRFQPCLDELLEPQDVAGVENLEKIPVRLTGDERQV